MRNSILTRLKNLEDGAVLHLSSYADERSARTIADFLQKKVNFIVDVTLEQDLKSMLKKLFQPLNISNYEIIEIPGQDSFFVNIEYNKFSIPTTISYNNDQGFVIKIEDKLESINPGIYIHILLKRDKMK